MFAIKFLKKYFLFYDHNTRFCFVFFFLLKQTFNDNDIKDIMYSTFKLAAVEDLLLWKPIGFCLVQETYLLIMF